jgi:hypothetical protein
LTTYGDIVKIICEKIKEPEPDHYYLAMNYKTEMADNMVFELTHENQKFQLIMRTKWILEYIAEQTMQRQRMKPEIRQMLDMDTPVTEGIYSKVILVSLRNFNVKYEKPESKHCQSRVESGRPAVS